MWFFACHSKLSHFGCIIKCVGLILIRCTQFSTIFHVFISETSRIYLHSVNTQCVYWWWWWWCVRCCLPVTAPQFYYFNFFYCCYFIIFFLVFRICNRVLFTFCFSSYELNNSVHPTPSESAERLSVCIISELRQQCHYQNIILLQNINKIWENKPCINN